MARANFSTELQMVSGGPPQIYRNPMLACLGFVSSRILNLEFQRSIRARTPPRVGISAAFRIPSQMPKGAQYRGGD
jgi:hypothetical protein